MPIILFTLVEPNTGPAKVKNGWATALVDAGAAIQGGASGAFLGGALGSAVPILGNAAGAIGGGILGALIVGAAGSLAYATFPLAPVSSRPLPAILNPTLGDLNTLANPNNEFEIVGIMHNMIISDFFKASPGTDFDTIFNFIVSRCNFYGINTQGLNLAVLKKLAIEMAFKGGNNALNSAITFFGAFTSSSTLSKITSSIQNLNLSPNVAVFNTIIRNHELNLFHDGNINEKEMMYIKIYFSTLKFSHNLWQ